MKPYQRIRFNKAIAWFRRKLPFPTERWNQVVNDAQNWAFTIAGIESANVLQAIQDKLTQVLSNETETAQTFEEFRSTFNEQMAKAGYAQTNPWRSILTFRNNINSAYNAGRFQQIQESPNEYVQYWHDHPISPRPAHLALHRMVFRKDDPILQVLNPPNGHGCLCKLLSISQSDIDDEGLEVSTLRESVRLRDRLTGEQYSVPAIRVDGELMPVVEPGFNHSPGLDDEKRKGEIIAGAIARLSPRLQELVVNNINFSEYADFGQPCGRGFIPDDHECTKSPVTRKNRLDEIKDKIRAELENEQLTEREKKYLIISNGKTYNKILEEKGQDELDKLLQKRLEKRVNSLAESAYKKEQIEEEKNSMLNGSQKAQEQYAAYSRLYPNDANSMTFKEWKSKNKALSKTLIKDYREELRLDEAFKLENVLSRGRSLASDLDGIESIPETEALVKMINFRQNLLSSSKVGGRSFADNIKVSPEIGRREELNEATNEALRFSNGLGSQTLKNYIVDTSRAYASRERESINVGFANLWDKTVLFHEIGHHIEFSRDQVLKAAEAWRTSRASSPNPVQLEGYNIGEMAVPGNFISPYVGKVYSRSTEVVSMGFQHFANAFEMLNFYNRDREHFYLTLGLIRDD